MSKSFKSIWQSQITECPQVLCPSLPWWWWKSIQVVHGSHPILNDTAHTTQRIRVEYMLREVHINKLRRHRHLPLESHCTLLNATHVTWPTKKSTFHTCLMDSERIKVLVGSELNSHWLILLITQDHYLLHAFQALKYSKGKFHKPIEFNCWPYKICVVEWWTIYGHFLQLVLHYHDLHWNDVDWVTSRNYVIDRTLSHNLINTPILSYILRGGSA